MVSDDAKDLIKNCLNFEHKKRFSADQCLNHTWIKGFKS
jgi:calcium-dependent protein kinase